MKIVVTPHAGSRPDRGGDPLDGLVNLFDLGVVLSVAFLLAALSSLNLDQLLTKRDALRRAAQEEIRAKSGPRSIRHGSPIPILSPFSSGTATRPSSSTSRRRASSSRG